MPELAPGDVFADHRIEAVAGRGGMGVVYRATQLGLGRTVALKVIAPALAGDEDFRRRFVAESRAAAAIEHPNVIPVHDAGERDGVPYIVMRYVDGPDLRALVRATGALEPARAAHIVAQVGDALDAAHRHGLVHRDVKPANVLLDEHDHAYLTDFGLTKRAASGGAGLSRAGGWVGTLGYVAPEQIRGDPIDPRTDVYALGCVLVHALTGSAPYVRDSDEATLWAHLNAPPPSETVPPEFEGVVARALAKDPSDRYPSAGDLGHAALRAAGRSVPLVREGPVARRPAPVATAGRPDGETRPSPPSAGATTPTTATAAHRAAAGRPMVGDGRRLRALAAGGVALLAAGAALALTRDEDSGPASTPSAAGGPRPSRVDLTLPDKLARPNALTIAGGDVWALSFREGTISLVDAATGRPAARLNVGIGGTSLAAGNGSVWVAKATTRTVLRYDARTHERVPGGSLSISRPGRNVAVATGAGAVWVAVRNRSADDPGPEAVVRIDPRTGAQREIPVADGVQDLAVGAGAVWVTSRRRSTVTRIATRGLAQHVLAVGRGPRGIAVGEGAVWVATHDGDEITRIDPRTLDATPIHVAAALDRIAVGGGSVWATASEAGRLVRLDARTSRVVEQVQTGSRPFALDITRGRAVWLTLIGADGLQRVRFERLGA